MFTPVAPVDRCLINTDNGGIPGIMLRLTGKLGGLVALALTLAAAAGLFLARWEDPQRRAVGDTYWYIRQSLIFAGTAPDRAASIANQAVCADINRSLRAAHQRPTCRTYGVLKAPRYQAIFDNRPGYPLLAAPFVAVLGGWRGLALTTFLLAMLSAALAYAAITMATGRRWAGVFGGVLLFVLPSGFWMTRLLTESGVFAGYLAILTGTLLVGRGRKAGLPIIVAAMGWLLAVRSASGVAAALAIACASLIALMAHRRTDDRRSLSGPLLIGGLALLVLVCWQVATAVFNLPGLDTTIQDLASSHWRRPEVPDPVGWLIDANVVFWPRQGRAILPFPAYPTAFLFAAVLLVRHLRAQALPWLTLGLSGLLMMVAHPEPGQWDRMIAPMWLPVACAFGVAAAIAIRAPRIGVSTGWPVPLNSCLAPDGPRPTVAAEPPPAADRLPA